MKAKIFSASGFNQFGLYHDDALQETPEVKEALSRLPQVPILTTVKYRFLCITQF